MPPVVLSLLNCWMLEMYKYLVDLLRGNKDRLTRAEREEVADALIDAGRRVKLSREKIQDIASRWWDDEWADWMEGFARDIENEVNRGGRS